MGYLEDARQAAGTGLSTLGSIWQIPNLGISQGIAGSPTPVAPLVGNQQPGFAGTSLGQLSSNQGNNGQVQGASTGGYSPVNQSINTNQGNTNQGNSNNPTPTQPAQSTGGQPTSPGTNVNEFRNGWRWDGKNWQPPEGQGGQSGPSEADLNAVYQPSMDYLNQAEGNLRADLPNVLNAAQQAYETAIQELTGNKQKNTTTITNNQVAAGQQKEDALAAARRLYSQLRMGYQQRFGGSSSAGQAASELSSVEQQRQMGQTTRQYQDTVNQINQQKLQLDTDYQTGQMKLQQSKDQAVATAQSDFQNKLLSISQNRAQIESAKAQARLDALQTLRNQVFSINQQNAQFQQALDAQNQASQNDLQNYIAKLQASGQGSTNTAQSFIGNTTTNPQSGLQVGNSSPVTQGLTGQISNNQKDLMGQIGFKSNTYDPYNIYNQ